MVTLNILRGSRRTDASACQDENLRKKPNLVRFGSAYRTMYKSAFISGAFMLIAELFTLPLAAAMTQIPESTEKFANYMQLGAYYAEHLGEAGAIPLLLAVIVNTPSETLTASLV